MINKVNTNNTSNPLHFEVRKVQQQRNGRSLIVTLPTRYTKRMSLNRGDLLKMYLDYGGKLLVSEKVELSRSSATGDVQ